MPAFLAPLALKLAPIGRFLKPAVEFVGRLLGKQLQLRVWMIVAIAALAWHWHGGRIEAAIERTNAHWKAEFDQLAAKAFLLKRKADQAAAKISTDLRSRNDETHRAIARAYDDVRLRGPGKAACPGGAGIPAGAGGHVAAAGPADAAVAAMPDRERLDLIALPFGPTVEFAEQHDRCRADLLSYREWERQVRAIWPK